MIKAPLTRKHSLQRFEPVQSFEYVPIVLLLGMIALAILLNWVLGHIL